MLGNVRIHCIHELGFSDNLLDLIGVTSRLLQYCDQVIQSLAPIAETVQLPVVRRPSSFILAQAVEWILISGAGKGKAHLFTGGALRLGPKLLPTETLARVVR